MAGSGRGPARAALALFGGGAADFLEEERVDASFGIVARHAGQTSVHHVTNAIDGHGSLGDVGSDDYFAERIRGERAILVFGRQLAVQWDERQPLVGARGAQG